jgi:nicotinamidase-related amidase
MPRVALLLIDVINAFDFDGSEDLVRAARPAADAIAELAAAARAADVPVIYVNDNFGQWRSDFASTVRACTKKTNAGREIGRRLRPHPEDYFVLKPQHSGFYLTPLDLLLRHLDVHTLVLTGFAANLCVVFTANDAHMRGYRVAVPRDCTASNTPELTEAVLVHVETALGGDTCPSNELDFAKLSKQRKRARGQTF